MVEYPEDTGFRNFAGTPADPSQVSEQTGLEDDTRRVAEALLGAVGGIDNGARGKYYFDAFESRRQSSIGSLSST